MPRRRQRFPLFLSVLLSLFLFFMAIQRGKLNYSSLTITQAEEEAETLRAEVEGGDAIKIVLLQSR